MGRITTTVAERSYTLNVLEPRTRGDLYQAVLIAQLIDELTSEALRGQPRISTGVAGARPRYAQDGVAGLAGVPTRLFPRLDAQAYPLDVTFEIDGFVPLTVDPTPSLPIRPTFPADFDGIDLGPLTLRRRPIVLTPRTIQLDPQHRPIAVPFARAWISGIWRTAKDILSSAPSPAANLVSFGPALYAARPQPATTIDAVTMTPAVEPDRHLLLDVGAGERRLVVDRGGGLTNGAIVGIDRGDVDRVEHIRVDTVTAPSDPDSPAVLDLAFAVRNRHHASAPVHRVTPSAPTPLATLVDDGRPGDVTLFVNSTVSFGPGAMDVQITGGTSAAEYGTCSRYRVTTDGQGYGALPPLSRVAAVEVSGALGALTSTPLRVTPDYRVFETRADVTLA